MAKVLVATVLTTTLGGIGLLSAGPTERRAPAASTTRPARVAPVPPSLPARESVVPDCGAVGQHMAELKVSAADPTKQLPTAKRAVLVGVVAREITSRCKVEGWNDNRRVCAAWATDIGVAKTGCDDELAASPEEAALPAEMQCGSIAKHVADLLTGPDGKLALFAKKSAAGGHAVDMQKLVAEVRTQQAAECERVPWSTARRRCILASTTNRALGSCL